MSGVYTSEVNGVSVSAIQDLFEILAATDQTIELLKLQVGQTSDVADAEEEILNLILTRGIGSVTSGSGGSTPSMHPREDGQAAAGAVVEANNTTQMVVGTGTLENLETINWNIRVPLEHIWLPEDRPVISPGNRIAIELKAPGDAITLDATLTWKETGG